MDIVTGHVGSAHVTSWQDRDLNQGIFGPDTYILNVGSKMAASIITNNEIHIADGALVMQGCQGVIQKGTYDSISIDNGSSGMKRKDLICAEYTKVGGVESLGWTVIKGTPAASNPSEPSYTSGDIQNGDTPVQVPVYQVNIDGLTIDGVYALVNVNPLSSIANVLGTYYDDASNSGTFTNNVSRSVASLSLQAGTYILFGAVYFSSNSSGYRKAEITGIGALPVYSSYLEVMPMTNRPTVVELSCFTYLTATTTVTLEGFQNSGSSLTGNGQLTAVRLK